MRNAVGYLERRRPPVKFGMIRRVAKPQRFGELRRLAQLRSDVLGNHVQMRVIVVDGATTVRVGDEIHRDEVD